MNDVLEEIFYDLEQFASPDLLSAAPENSVDPFDNSSVVEGSGIESVEDPVIYVPAEVNDIEDFQAVVAAAVSEALAADGSSAGNALATTQQLDSIGVDLQALVNVSYLFSPTSTQASYFQGVVMQHPFYDYYAYQNDTNSYYLYYAPKLTRGSSCNYIHQYRTMGTGATYVIDKGSTTFPSVSFDSFCITNLSDNCAAFPEVVHAKNETFTCIGLCTALGLYALGRILFR